MNRKSTITIAAAAAATALGVTAAVGAATDSNRVLAFKTVSRGTVPWKPSVGRPTGAVEQQRSMSAHYVKIRRGRLGFNVPDHIILRERRTAVLYATPGSRTGACRG